MLNRQIRPGTLLKYKEAFGFKNEDDYSEFYVVTYLGGHVYCDNRSGEGIYFYCIADDGQTHKYYFSYDRDDVWEVVNY